MKILAPDPQKIEFTSGAMASTRERRRQVVSRGGRRYCTLSAGASQRISGVVRANCWLPHPGWQRRYLGHLRSRFLALHGIFSGCIENRKGPLCFGADADLVILDRSGNVFDTWIRGEEVCLRERVKILCMIMKRTTSI